MAGFEIQNFNGPGLGLAGKNTWSLKKILRSVIPDIRHCKPWNCEVA
jgi:hypothetical protein